MCVFEIWFKNYHNKLKIRFSFAMDFVNNACDLSLFAFRVPLCFHIFLFFSPQYMIFLALIVCVCVLFTFMICIRLFFVYFLAFLYNLYTSFCISVLRYIVARNSNSKKKNKINNKYFQLLLVFFTIFFHFFILVLFFFNDVFVYVCAMWCDVCDVMCVMCRIN